MSTNTPTPDANPLELDNMAAQATGERKLLTVDELADARKRADELLDAAGQCAISEEEFDELFGLCCGLRESLPDETNRLLERRLNLAVNSYCHILRIGCDLKDETVDLETASRICAHLDACQPLSDEEVRLVGKRGTDCPADEKLFMAFLGLIRMIQGKPLKQKTAQVQVVPVQYYTPLSDEQFEMLAQSIFEQVVVRSTPNVTDKANFGRWASESPALRTRLQLAFMIGLHSERYRDILPKPDQTPAQRKAEADYIEDICRRAKNPDSLSPQECYFLLNHRPTSLSLKERMFDAAPLWEENFIPIMQKADNYRPIADGNY